MQLEEMRASYRQAELDENSVLASPIDQLNQWIDEAESAKPGKWFEVNAMTLSTCDNTGYVTSRIVLLKRADQSGLYFYTNRDSQKGRQLAENTKCSFVFYWPHLERQVRVEGTATPTDNNDSDRYFHSRPRGSQIGAAASQQSRRVSNRQELQAEFSQLESRYQDGEIPRPPSWGGYQVTPTLFEFWQGRPNRLHDRVVYEQSAKGWEVYRRAP